MAIFDDIFKNLTGQDLFGGSADKTQLSVLSPEQIAAQNKLLGFAGGALSGSANQRFPGQLVAGTPQLFNTAFNQFSSDFGNAASTNAINDLISGKPAFEFDEQSATDRWRRTFADPVMQAWRETVAPVLKESLNLPGSLFSRGTGQFLAQQGSQFFGSQVAPTLFNTLSNLQQSGIQSRELAAARQPAALGLPFQQFSQAAGVAGAQQAQLQAPLTAAYQEFQRTDPFRYAQLLGGIASTPTQENIIEPGTDYLAALLGGAGAAAGAFAGA